MTPYEELYKEIQSGMEGRNHSISMGFHRLNKYIGIRKKIMTLVFGASGSGKTALVHDAYILNPFDWWLANKDITKVKPVPVLFSFERSRIYTVSKWLCRRIYKKHGWDIPIGKLLGWWPDNKLTHNEHDLVLCERDYINELCEFCSIQEGAQNPTGPRNFMKNLALSRGRIEQISEHKKVYIPDNEYEIVIPIRDHIGLTLSERGYNKKESIDKGTEYAQELRDFYGMAPVDVAQTNRELGSAMWQKNDNMEPTIDQIKETGTPGEAADIILSIFDPIRYRTQDNDYDAQKFINTETGARCFRSIKLIKSTYSEDGVKIGMGFRGQQGIFAELPKKANMNDSIYENVINGKYFLG